MGMTEANVQELQKYQKEGAELFTLLYAQGSAVRHLSEARRENSADDYDAGEFDKTALSLMGDSLDQTDRVMGMFASQPLPE